METQRAMRGQETEREEEVQNDTNTDERRTGREAEMQQGMRGQEAGEVRVQGTQSPAGAWGNTPQSPSGAWGRVPRMEIYTASRRTDARFVRASPAWEDLAALLSHPVRTGETCAQFRAMSREQRIRIKDVGGFVGGTLADGLRRANAVRSRCLLTLDADHLPPGGDAALADDWRRTFAAEALLHATHASAPDAPRIRLVAPLARAVSPAEYARIARAVMRRLGPERFDDTAAQPERMMFWPSIPRDARFFLRRVRGPWLDPDALLAGDSEGMRGEAKGAEGMYGDAKASEGMRGEAKASNGMRGEAKASNGMRGGGAAMRRADPTARDGLIGAFCRAYDVPAAIRAFLPGIYAPAGPGRFTFLPGSSQGGAVVYDGGRFLFSFHETDPARGRLLNAFDLVRIHRFGGDPGDPASALGEMIDLCRGDARVQRARGASGRAGEGKRRARRTQGRAERTKEGTEERTEGRQERTKRAEERTEGTEARQERAEEQAERTAQRTEGRVEQTEEQAQRTQGRAEAHKRAAASGPAADDRTEQGVAVAFARAFRDRLCWGPSLRWVAWDGVRWAPAAEERAVRCAMQFTDGMLRDAAARLRDAPPDRYADALAALRWANACRAQTRIARVLRLARALLDGASPDAFDANPFDLNTPAGIVDLRTGQLRPHDPDARCTACTAVAPAPDALVREPFAPDAPWPDGA